MSPFITLVWPARGETERAEATAFEERLMSAGDWRTVFAAPGCCVYGRSQRPLTVRTDGAECLLVIGDLFTAQGQDAPPKLNSEMTCSVQTDAQALLTRYWGRYVSIHRDPGGFRGVLRDPCGAGDTSIWRRSGVVIIASEMPQSLLKAFGPRQGLNWTALHALAADPYFASTISPFLGMNALPSGGLATPEGSGFRLTQLWRPSTFARDPVADAFYAEDALRNQVDLCVKSYGRQPGAILAEVSGGFDSAVIAACLRKAKAPVISWCNHYTSDRSGDERSFALAVGQKLGVEINCRPRPRSMVSPDLLSRSQFGLRPSAFALDAIHDEDTLAVAETCGAERLFSGLGGDGLFYSMPLPTIARDIVKRRGLRSLIGPEIANLARWSRKSIWTTARAGLIRSVAKRALGTPLWVADGHAQTAGASHPWLDDLEDLSPAKRLHVEEQVLALLAGGTSLRSQKLDVVHPLISQPVMELCLRIPVERLVEGGRDRALARRAFCNVLPAEINDRRSKGELGLYYGRGVAEGLPALKEFLLEGRLVKENLLVRAGLEQVLTESHLAQHGGLFSLLSTVAIEGWVRRWEDAASG